MTDEEKEVKKPKVVIEFRDILAIIFILLAVGINLTAIALIFNAGLSDTANVFIGGSVQTFNTMLVLIIQFYFRKKPSEKEGEKD